MGKLGTKEMARIKRYFERIKRYKRADGRICSCRYENVDTENMEEDTKK